MMSRNHSVLHRSRRRVFAISTLLALLTVGNVLTPAGAAAQDASSQNVIDQFANVALPGDLGQVGVQAYVPASEHTVRGYLLDYWRANGAASVFGDPISEPFASANGFYSQAFAGGVFQYIPDLVWTDSPAVSLMPISQPLLNDRIGDFRADGRREGGGGDRRTNSWRPLDPNGNAVQRAVNGGGTFSSQTGHTITNEFLTWYQAHEGASYLGNPISQPLAERGMTVQYFDGALLMRNDSGVVSVAPLAQEGAAKLGIDTTAVAQGDLPTYSETSFWTIDNPNPLGPPDAPGKKWLEVSISQQTLSAYQGTTLVSSSLVSTGIEPNHTEQGVFHVRYKLPKTDMAGTIDTNGAVDALGQQAADAANQGQLAGQFAYVVKDVPDVMYFDSDAEALHGAYWHNNFGVPMSHGCVNLPLDYAHFLFGWAPLGTMVWVHE